MENKPFTVSVSQLNRKIAFMLKDEKSFINLCVRGELSGFTVNARSGHIYFTLKDETASIDGIMYRSNAERLRFTPESGQAVVVLGNISFYEPSGRIQIVASDFLIDGEGEQAAALDKLKEKLKAEGLFDRKRPLPQSPSKICVITSEGAAVLRDIYNVISRRCPLVELLLVPAAVQGEEAPASVAAAFERANRTDADLIIFGRGGGSAEDLSAFNSEIIARAVFASRIPTISAVGHETDFSICDFVADMRAPTPSAAAELAVPDIYMTLKGMSDTLGVIERKAYAAIEAKLKSVKMAELLIKAKSPMSRIEQNEQKLITAEKSVKSAFSKLVERKESALRGTASVIEKINPLAVLMRGYAIAYKDGKAIISADDVKAGDIVRVKLSGGEFTAEVK